MQDVVKLVADDSSYQATMSRAGAAADRFAGRVHKAGGGLEALFKRSPHMRAERALSGFISQAATGDMVGALTSITGKMTGLGLAAGVAVGVGVELFEKFHTSIKAVEGDSEALRRELLKPMDVIGGLSPDGIQKQADQVKGIYDKMVADHASFTNKIVEYARDTFSPGHAEYGKHLLEQRREEQTALDAFHARQKEAGRSTLEQEKGLTMTRGDSKATALSELYFKSRAEESAIRLEGGKGAGDKLKAVEEKEHRLTDEIVHRAEIREKELALTERLLKLEGGAQKNGTPISDTQKKQISLAGRLHDIKEELASPDTGKDEKRTLGLEFLQKQGELRDISPQKKPNPFPSGTPANRGFESQFGAGGLERRGIEDSLGFGGLAKRSLDRGESLTPEEALLKTGTSADQIAGFKKNVGELPGGPQQDGAVVTVLNEIKAIIDTAWAK